MLSHPSANSYKLCIQSVVRLGLSLLIAVHLSARLLIVQCSRLTFVCIYICKYIYIYSSHFNRVGAVSVVSYPYYEARSTGLTTRRSRCDCARVEMEQARATWYWSNLEAIDVWKRSCESQNGAGAVRCKRDCARERKWKQRDTASEESKAKENESDRLRKKRCIQGESRVTLHLAHFETLQTTALPSSPLLTPGYLLAYFRYPSVRGILCACVFLE